MEQQHGNTENAPLRWGLVLGATVLLALVLTYLPGRTTIAPVIESDYAHQLLAVDRLEQGQGLTSLQPVAPSQPWTWRYDFGFLTQWPAGYSLLVWIVRKTFSTSTIDACRWIGVIACAAALVGWFTWTIRFVPGCLAGYVLAALAAGSAVTTGFLVHPSTDVILIAALPFLLLATVEAVAVPHRADPLDLQAPRSPSMGLKLAFVGLAAGGFFWIRYAAIFVPISIGVFLLLQWFRRRELRVTHVLLYACGAVTPIAALLVVNRILAQPGSLQSQLNLGGKVGFAMPPGKFAQAWWNFSNLGYYDHHAVTHWLYALAPPALIVGVACIAPVRRAAASLIRSPAFLLSAVLVTGLLVMLLGATALFGDKFDYVGLERYYRPVRPLYFALFVAPILLIRHRVFRLAMVPVLLVACSWTAAQEWGRSYAKLISDTTEVTPYGTHAICFTPGASKLYDWLNEQKAPDLIVVSNFREVIALETGMAPLPIPRDKAELERWIQDIRRARGIEQPRIRFVIDPNNRWRSYWLPSLRDTENAFDLSRRIAAPPGVSAVVYDYGAPANPNSAVADAE